jgi:hypothetical protein
MMTITRAIPWELFMIFIEKLFYWKYRGYVKREANFVPSLNFQPFEIKTLPESVAITLRL